VCRGLDVSFRIRDFAFADQRQADVSEGGEVAAASN